MRILVLNYEYPPLGGGAGIATAALVQALIERGTAVDVVTASVTGEARVEQLSAASGSGSLRLFRVRSRRIGIHEAGMMGAASYLLSALPLVRQLLQTHRYNLVHVFFSLPTGALLPLLDLGGVPLIVSLRGSDVPGYDPFNVSIQLFHRVLAPLTRWIWRRADRVVPVCESLGRLALKTRPELAYSVVPNGVDLEPFHPAHPARPTDRVPIRCLAVARLVERKGLGELIRAFAHLPRGKYQLEIVGDGPDERVLRDLAHRMGVGDEILFRGALDRPGVASRYRAADLFTLPSSAEAFGNVFAEALASGLPVVGSDVGGIPDLIEHGVNGFLVTPGNPQTLAQAIQYLANDPELRTAMSLRNRAKAEATLNWTQVTSRYVSIYEGVMKQLHAPSLVPHPIGSAL